MVFHWAKESAALNPLNCIEFYICCLLSDINNLRLLESVSANRRTCIKIENEMFDKYRPTEVGAMITTVYFFHQQDARLHKSRKTSHVLDCFFPSGSFLTSSFFPSPHGLIAFSTIFSMTVPLLISCHILLDLCDSRCNSHKT